MMEGYQCGAAHKKVGTQGFLSAAPHLFSLAHHVIPTKEGSACNLLNYNLAYTAYNQKDYDKAEEAAIQAIMAKPTHGSSHIISSATMEAKGQS